MTRDNWERLGPLFEQAIQLGAEKRPAFFSEVRARDGELGLQLESLANAHEHETFFINQPLVLLKSLLAEEVPVFSPGEVVAGRFTISRLIGSGGMGDVYEAEDDQLGRIALKTIRPDLAGSAQALARFRREVELARRVSSYQVCRIHELFALPARGRTPASAFLTMEFLEGATLTDRIRQGGAIPWREAEPIALQLCEGLAAVHEAGIVHRDLKCRNIMLSTRQGGLRVVLMDFGLAHEVAVATAAGTGRTDTVSLGLAGTPEYMAPEQFEAGLAGPASDVYALGIVLYEMLTTKRPHAASTLYQGKRLPPPSSIQSGLPRRWDEAIARCLEYEPAGRFRSAREVAEALASQPSSRQVARAVRMAPKSRRVQVLVVGLLLALTGEFFWHSRHRPYVPSPIARNGYDRGVRAAQEGTFLTAAGMFQSALQVDKNFALARARLADAWNELDYKRKADEQIKAISAAQESRLSPGDDSYVAGLRAMLRSDFDEAARNFELIRDRLSGKARAAADVDLGRVFEKGGKIERALDPYAEAQKLDPHGPAAWLRSAMLEARGVRTVQAGADFDRAQQLYQESGNLEGVAEVNYQRSYWQSAALGKFDEAREQASLSLKAAQGMPSPSVPLEVRAICRLSDIDFAEHRFDRAVAEADQAIAIAHKNGLSYWETAALLRQGAGYMGQADSANAGKSFQKALTAAEGNHWPQLAALSELDAANLRSRLGQSQDEKSFAAAVDYYKVYGFPNESFNALLLFSRWKLDSSQHVSALSLTQDLEGLANKLESPKYEAKAKEAMGVFYFDLGDYPAALARYEEAGKAAETARDSLSAEYHLAHSALTLAFLGRFEEAESALKRITSSALSDEKVRIRGYVLLHQGRQRELLQLALNELNRKANLPPAITAEFCLMGSQAATELGLLPQARDLWSEAQSLAAKESDAGTLADSKLAESLWGLRAKELVIARSSAEAASEYYHRAGPNESEWLSLCYLAFVNHATGPQDLARESAKKALDFLNAFQHNWSVSDVGTYTTRADVSSNIQELRQILKR